MKKTEMVKRFIEKVGKIEGVEVCYEKFCYWDNQPKVVVDNKHIAWLVDTCCMLGGQYVRCVSEMMTTKELKEFFDDVLAKIQDALEEQQKYSLEIEKMLRANS